MYYADTKFSFKVEDKVISYLVFTVVKKYNNGSVILEAIPPLPAY